jgi:hypothetical protein
VCRGNAKTNAVEMRVTKNNVTKMDAPTINGSRLVLVGGVAVREVIEAVKSSSCSAAVS